MRYKIESKAGVEAVFSVLSLIVLGIFMHLCSSASAQGTTSTTGQVSIVSISPAATEITSEIPPVPARISIFGWQGIPNTDYVVQISIDTEPALVVGVGARVRSTQFDTIQKVLSVTVRYEGTPILVDDQLLLPDKSFLVAVDPGIDKASSLINRNRSRSDVVVLPAQSSRPCYGPGADVTRSQDTSGDFGDQDGLLDPPVASTADLTVGFPKLAAGSYASTNSFFWCAIPPSNGGVDPGFTVMGLKGATDKVELFLSSSFLTVLGTSAGLNLSAANLALFSQGVQVSIDVTDLNGGAFADATLLLQDGVTSVGHEPKSFIIPSAADLDPKSTKNVRSTARLVASPLKAAAQAALIARSFEFGQREKVSLAPSNTAPTGSSLGLFGFVGDPAFIGGTIEIIRIQQLRCNDPETSSIGDSTRTVSALASNGVVIARDQIGANGSFNIKIPTSSAFPTNNSHAMLVSRITGDQVQQSRQISLSNQSRNSRR